MTDGFLNVLKPPGMSSHDIVGAVRKILGIKKVGHAGTLDPGAAGVLPVAVGKATRLVEYLSSVDKSYRAELAFGIATDSGDVGGKVIARAEAFIQPSEEELQAALRQLTGEITQVPPVYSAIKIKGQRACDLMRQNIAVEIPERQVHIYRFALLARRENSLLLDVDCSKGTYIRTLCTDLGNILGIPAAMSFLVRTRVGDFRLEESYTLEELKEAGCAALVVPEEQLSHIVRYELAEHRARAFCNGLATHDRTPGRPGGLLRVFSQGIFLGIGRYDAKEQAVVPEKVFAN